jgi:hypothetical protein
MTSPITTLTFFHIKDGWHKLWAFSQMQLAHAHLQHISGLQFYKLLGTGAKGGFRWSPNYAVYAFLGVWETEGQAREFLSHSTFSRRYFNHTDSRWTIFMNSIKAEGLWSGQNPFPEMEAAQQYEGPIAVITRATIYPRHLYGFWKRVAPVSQALGNHNGLLFSVGVGELPVIQQATFSLWTHSQAMMDYAYKNPLHREVIKKTRQLGWYKEEMFSRFMPYATEGSWPGVELNAIPLEKY